MRPNCRELSERPIKYNYYWTATSVRRIHWRAQQSRYVDIGSRRAASTVFDLTIDYPNATTHVVVTPDVLHRIGSLLQAALGTGPASVALLVTDEQVGVLYGDTVFVSLKRGGFQPYEHRITPGEASKSLPGLSGVYEALVASGAGRDGLVLALGGGVVSDLAGFAAATWMRGIRFAICPTTLEADVDASIGGKTAINIPGAKNLVGAFHQPCLVAVDPLCLETLEERDIRAGMAESLKHALVSSAEFLDWQEEHAGRILALDPERITALIQHNIRIKADIVRQDVHEETGARMVLNLGHTIGHAIEECCGFSLRHGECVALGTLAACRLSHTLGALRSSVVERVERLLTRFGLPTTLVEPIQTERILRTIRNDKKVRRGQVQFVVLEEVGRPSIRDDVPEAAVREAYETLLP